MKNLLHECKNCKKPVKPNHRFCSQPCANQFNANERKGYHAKVRFIGAAERSTKYRKAHYYSLELGYGHMTEMKKQLARSFKRTSGKIMLGQYIMRRYRDSKTFPPPSPE